MKQMFLDIEGTLVEDMNHPRFIVHNIQKIKDKIDLFQPEKISTFSFALWEEKDFIQWNQISNTLSKNTGMNIAPQSFDLLDLKLEFLRDLIGKASEQEIWDFNKLLNKERMFEWFIRKNFKQGHFILFDDLVPNKTIILDELTIEFIDASKL